MSEFTIVFDQRRYECADPRAPLNYERTESGIKTATNNQNHWGSLTVNANCCRRFDVFVNVTGLPGAKPMAYEGTVATCSGPVAAGTKYFSSDTFTVKCPATGRKKWTVTFPDDTTVTPPATHWVGGNVYIVVDGPCSTGGGELQVTVDITSQSAMNTAAAAYQSLLLALGCFGGTPPEVTAVYNGGSGRYLEFSFANDATAPTALSFGSEAVVNDNEANFTDVPVLGGPSTTSPGGDIDVYLRTTFAGCDRNEITVNLHLDSDDSVIATWKNKHHGMRCGYRTVLALTHQSCLGICDDGSVGSLQNMPETLCFVPNAFAVGCGDTNYLPHNWTFTSGATELAPALSGSTGRQNPLIQQLLTGSGSGSFNSLFTVTISGFTGTFTGAGGSRNYGASAQFNTNCNTNIASTASGRATTGVYATSSTAPIFTLTGDFGTGDVYAVWFIVRYGSVAATLPCSDLTLTHSSVEFSYVAVPTGNPAPAGWQNPPSVGQVCTYGSVNPIPSEFTLAPSGQYYPFA